jgi:hypothetical protein
MPKVTFSDAKGMVQSAGEGVEQEHSPHCTPRTLTADTTIAHPGYYKLASTSAITVTMPDPNSVAGGVFTFLTITNSVAHDLTGSRSGMTEFAAGGDPNGGHGGAMALSASTGASAVLMSTGDKYAVLCSSGTITYSGLSQQVN